MNKSSLMHLAERARERDRGAQKYCQFQRSTEQAVERFTARVREHQRQAVVVAGQCDWPRRPGSIQFGSERIFVFEPLEARERGIYRGDEQDRRQAAASAPVEGEVPLP